MDVFVYIYIYLYIPILRAHWARECLTRATLSRELSRGSSQWSGGPVGPRAREVIGLALIRASKRRGIRGKLLVTSVYSLQQASEFES